jgi:hypothetical protein
LTGSIFGSTAAFGAAGLRRRAQPCEDNAASRFNRPGLVTLEQIRSANRGGAATILGMALWIAISSEQLLQVSGRTGRSCADRQRFLREPHLFASHSHQNLACHQGAIIVPQFISHSRKFSSDNCKLLDAASKPACNEVCNVSYWLTTVV